MRESGKKLAHEDAKNTEVQAITVDITYYAYLYRLEYYDYSSSQP